jgi:hypothetical protein
LRINVLEDARTRIPSVCWWLVLVFSTETYSFGIIFCRAFFSFCEVGFDRLVRLPVTSSQLFVDAFDRLVH